MKGNDMRILYISCNEIIIYLPNKPAFTLYNSEGKVLDMLDKFLCPVDQSNFVRLSDYRQAVQASNENTQVIEQDDWTLALEYANLCM